jgi:endonuclease YncB( thermonuclease family)
MLILSKNPFPNNSSFPPLWEKVGMGGIAPNISEKCRVIKVVEGDTFDCRFGWFKTERIRLIGVGTPETKHPKKPVEYCCWSP